MRSSLIQHCVRLRVQMNSRNQLNQKSGSYLLYVLITEASRGYTKHPVCQEVTDYSLLGLCCFCFYFYHFFKFYLGVAANGFNLSHIQCDSPWCRSGDHIPAQQPHRPQQVGSSTDTAWMAWDLTFVLFHWLLCRSIVSSVQHEIKNHFIH